METARINVLFFFLPEYTCIEVTDVIRLTKHIRISPLTIFLFAFTVVFEYPAIFYVTYTVMALHETAHLIAAVSIGLRVDYIALMPFGLNLRLKNKLILSFSEEIILYISGPLVNALAAVCAAAAYEKWGIPELRLFYISNAVLFGANLLPAFPLDGGFITKRLLSALLGHRWALRIMRILSVLICTALMTLGIMAVIGNIKNFSVLMFAALLVGNIFAQREKYTAEYISGQVLADMKCEM